MSILQSPIIGGRGGCDLYLSISESRKYAANVATTECPNVDTKMSL